MKMSLYFSGFSATLRFCDWGESNIFVSGKQWNGLALFKFNATLRFLGRSKTGIFICCKRWKWACTFQGSVRHYTSVIGVKATFLSLANGEMARYFSSSMRHYGSWPGAKPAFLYVTKDENEPVLFRVQCDITLLWLGWKEHFLSLANSEMGRYFSSSVRHYGSWAGVKLAFLYVAKDENEPVLFRVQCNIMLLWLGWKQHFCLWQTVKWAGTFPVQCDITVLGQE